jgi:type IV pilus assembly protein PilY1
MKLSKILLIALLFAFTLFIVPCFGTDTDLYISKGSGVPPNILIIFDNSGSMDSTIPGPKYDPNHEYDPLAVDVAYKNKVYNCTSSGCNKYISSTNWKDYSAVSCNATRTALGTLGYWQGRLTNTSACGNWSNPSYTLRTGNYRNYLAWLATDPMYSRRKIDIARDIIKEFIDQAEGVRVGLMIYYSSAGGHILVGPSPDNYRCDIADLIVRDGATQAQLDADTAIRTKLKAALDSLEPYSYTPLAETLYEAGLYYRGHQSYFEYTGSSPKVYRQYVSPVQYSCQSNNVIIITDGDSTQDRDDILRYGKTIGTVTYPAIGDQDGDKWEPGYSNEKHYYDCSNCVPACSYPDCPNNNSCCNDQDGSDYLDDVAKYLYEAKDSSVSINTNTIGFAVKSQNDLLGRAAVSGNGKYFYSETGQDLAKNFQSVIGNILAVTTSYVAPIVPVSQYEKTTAGDKIYLALFKPIQNDIWVGNIKKYGVAQPVGTTSDCTNDGSFAVGEILDADCRRALKQDGVGQGTFLTGAKSYWNNILDGGEAASGGVGEVLKNRDLSSDPRKIYTYLGSDVDLTKDANKFVISNISITATMLGVLTEDERKSVINFVHGYDYSATAGDKRSWILGAIIHSRPVVVRYPDYHDQTVIYVGSNDGMLHAFDDSDGSELWAFIPPTLLNQLSALHLGGTPWFVDGSPRVYLGTDKKILVFGLRRGGDILTKSNCYVALNITNPTSPQFLWMITPDKIVKGTVSTPSTAYSELGQTWSNPQIGKIDDGTTSGQWVMFIGGGYDNYNQDKENPFTDVADSYGRAVYIVNIQDGSLVKRFSVAEDTTMTYSIPSDISRVDVNGDGKIDRLYVGDVAGRVWRFDITGSNKNNWTGKMVFRSNPSTAVTNLRKMFYPPDVTLENDAYAGDYEMLFFGTGDREHPSDKTIVNRLYGVKVKNPSIIYTEDDLYDATDNILQDGNDTDKAAALVQLKSKSGWFIRFEPDTAGEKSLSTPVVFYRTAYFTTFTPSPDAPPEGTDPCYVGEGTAKLYALGYFTGVAALNLDLQNDTSGTTISKSDRSEVIGSSIPSGVIITFVWGKGVAYTGVGGGIRSTKLPTDKSIVPIYWRTVF